MRKPANTDLNLRSSYRAAHREPRYRPFIYSVFVVSVCLSMPAAFASIPDAAGIIHGCYNTTNGTQRIIDTAVESCRLGEKAIQWNQTGPQGPQGPQGLQGPPGRKGDTGPAGTNRVYWAYNSHEVEENDSLTYQTIVGLSGLPAGWYVFSTTIQSAYFYGSPGIIHSADSADLQCITQLNGGGVQIGNVDDVRVWVPQISTVSDTYVLNVAANSSLIISCRVYSNGSKALANGRMTAFPVNTVSVSVPPLEPIDNDCGKTVNTQGAAIP